MDDGSTWQHQAPRGSRDDDYYGEGKRRKHNNGVSATRWFPSGILMHHIQGYDASYVYDKAYEEGGYDQGHGAARQGDYVQEHATDDRYQRGGGGGYNKKRLIPSEPSPHVIFLGLDPDFTEADVRTVSP